MFEVQSPKGKDWAWADSLVFTDERGKSSYKIYFNPYSAGETSPEHCGIFFADGSSYPSDCVDCAAYAAWEQAQIGREAYSQEPSFNSAPPKVGSSVETAQIIAGNLAKVKEADKDYEDGWPVIQSVVANLGYPIEGNHAPADPATRKGLPVGTGVVDYFPDALLEIAHVSKIGNDQHNPGQPLHWSRDQSTDHADCLMRHFIDRGKIDVDGERHSAKMAWRALALLQLEIEAEKATSPT